MKQFFVAVVFCFVSSLAFASASISVSILDRANSEFDSFRQQFHSIVRTVGPTREGRRLQHFVQVIDQLKREIWMAKQLLQIKDAVKNEVDRPVVRYMVLQSFNDLVAAVDAAVQTVNSDLRHASNKRVLHRGKDFAEFLKVYQQGLKVIQTHI